VTNASQNHQCCLGWQPSNKPNICSPQSMGLCLIYLDLSDTYIYTYVGSQQQFQIVSGRHTQVYKFHCWYDTVYTYVVL